MTQTKPICSWLRTFSGCLLAGSLSMFVPATYAEELVSLRQTPIVKAIQRAEPAVVNIEGNKPASGRSDGQQVNGMGAGVIIDARGYILTNQHVVQDVGRIEVTLASGRQYIGRMIDRDAQTDLALIKVDAGRPLPVIDCGTSSDLMHGETVIAIGNPYGYHHTVTRGIISSLKRDIPVNGVQEYPDLIQTDASINPGNSGGPLLNANGEMIGINAAVRMGAQGIGFAIPVDRAINVAAQMIARYRARKGSLASPVRVRTTYQDGASFVSVVSSSTSQLRSGDVLTAIGGTEIRNRLEYELRLLDHTAGSKLQVEGSRGGEAVSAEITMASSITGSTPRVQLASTNTSARRVSQIFGLQLEVANGSQINRTDPRYKGGLRVVSVRKSSPAYEAQLQPGDVLVGLLEWQTPQWKDLGWILSRPEFKNSREIQFRIMRGQDEYRGKMLR